MTAFTTADDWSTLYIADDWSTLYTGVLRQKAKRSNFDYRKISLYFD